jgi:4a-hydroxytetrahydrobiopterin dehydratase
MEHQKQPTKLPDAEINAKLKELPGWSLQQAKLFRDYKFRDFEEAFAFIVRVALIAQRTDHHPEIYNVWNTVELRLETHRAGGVSYLDIDFANRVNQLDG